MTTLRSEIEAFCAVAGTDPLLVQGAGGNVSWKDGDTLWIKASGTWLADAADKDIFVPVDLMQLRRDLADEHFDAKPIVLAGATLRPSIETVLHALMPQPVVVHLHAIEVLAHLVRGDCERDLAEKLPPTLHWAVVPYRKPGAELAKAVHEAVTEPGIEVVFLQNHGVVIGAENTAQVASVLDQLITKLVTPPVAATGVPAPVEDCHFDGVAYLPVADVEVQRLATDQGLFERLATQWALYPDHVVFLGAQAHLYDSAAAADTNAAQDNHQLIFVKGLGVFAQAGFNISQLAQLRCYFDVLVRQREGDDVRALTLDEIGALLNWDSERYRMGLVK